MSTLNVDALVGNTSANAITVRGEGTATTSLQQGLAKVWLSGSTTANPIDSLNVASGTDHGTGDYSYTLTNVFSNDDYSQTGTASSTDQRRNLTRSQRSTASVIGVELSDAGTLDDTGHAITVHGDLA